MTTLEEELARKSIKTAGQLPAPDVLFSRPPYTLLLSLSKTSITVQASHSASLQLIKSYFELHASTNPNDTRNVSKSFFYQFSCPVSYFSSCVLSSSQLCTLSCPDFASLRRVRIVNHAAGRSFQPPRGELTVTLAALPQIYLVKIMALRIECAID